MSRRGLTVLGLAAAGGAGYYLYNAGGDPKVAQKQMEADAHKASAKIKSEVPGRTQEAEKKGEALAASAGSKFDQAVSYDRTKDEVPANIHKSADAQKKVEEAKKEVNNLSSRAGAKWDQAKKLEEAKKEANSLSQKAGTEVNKAIDQFDKSVTDGAAKAKSGISSWFGGK